MAVAAGVCSTLTCVRMQTDTANIRTKILDFKGFDSSIVLMSRGGTLMSIGSFLESLSQQILAGIILVGRLGVDAWGPPVPKPSA